MARTILVPLPDRDFDVTEVAVPWRLLKDAGHSVVFATENGGNVPEADPLLLRGVIFGQLGAADEAKKFYAQMIESDEYRAPIAWKDIEPSRYDALLLPGGHAPGMRQYLGSSMLQERVAAFFALSPPRAVGAICHGVLVLARTKDETSGKSVLAGLRTTCLPKYMERLAYGLTFWKLGRYYRTYPAYVEDEVKASLDDPNTQFVRGPTNLGKRGTMEDDRDAMVVEDGRYVSARWPGDAYLFARRLMSVMERSG